jgi:hypothetical protein
MGTILVPAHIIEYFFLNTFAIYMPYEQIEQGLQLRNS